jgi:DNA replication regulator DPB11
MKIVSLEWFEQSLQRGMVLDEALYHPTLAVEERGKGAWDRREPSSPAMGKRPRDAEPSEALNPFRRKLRRSASTKMGTQSDALWAGITAANSERQQDYVDEWTEDQITAQANARQVTPATCAEDAVAPEDDAPANPDPAYTHALPGALSPDNDYGEGLFQGRVILLNGFDKDRVRVFVGRFGLC